MNTVVLLECICILNVLVLIELIQHYSYTMKNTKYIYFTLLFYKIKHNVSPYLFFI